GRRGRAVGRNRHIPRRVPCPSGIANQERSATAALAGPGSRAAGNAPRRRMLRFRWNLLREIRRAFGRDGADQNRRHRAHRREDRRLARPELPDADSGRTLARRFGHPHHAPGRGPGQPLTMSVEFDRKIHSTLADANLQLAIYTATGRLKEKRIEAVAPETLPDYQELRSQANAIKKHSI